MKIRMSPASTQPVLVVGAEDFLRAQAALPRRADEGP